MGQDRGTDKNNGTVDHSTNKFCINGGCVWIATDDGMELFEACETDCECSSTPPVVPVVPPIPPRPGVYRVDSKPAVSYIVPCEEVDPKKDSIGTLIHVGVLSMDIEYALGRDRADDCCVAISLGRGEWRYFRRSSHSSQDHQRGHMDKIEAPAGVIRLDLVSADRQRLERHWAVGFIKPDLNCG